jgi:hypothetical protein
VWSSAVGDFLPQDISAIQTLAYIVTDPDYGAAGDGVADDTTAIQAAISALPTTGGTLYFPPGDYLFSSTLSFDGKRSVRLLGANGLSNGAQATTRFVYSGAGTRAISARSTAGFTLDGIQVTYSNASFAGVLIDLSNSSGTDTAGALISNAFISGATGISGASSLVLLNKAINTTIQNVNFGRGDIAVKGRTTSGDYSNVIRIRDCQFNGQTTTAIANAGQSWLIEGCTFEPIASGAAGAYAVVGGISGANVVKFDGCWFGDASSSGTWIAYSGNGLNVTGNYMSGGAIGISVVSTCAGTDISGNQIKSMTTGVSFLGNSSGTSIRGNDFESMTTGIAFAQTTTGAGVHGNAFAITLTNAITLVGTSGSAVNITGNDILSTTNGVVVSGAMPSSSIIQLKSGNQQYFMSLFTVAGAVTDGAFPGTPPNGTMALDSTNSKLYIRVGGTWKGVTVA